MSSCLRTLSDFRCHENIVSSKYVPYWHPKVDNYLSVSWLWQISENIFMEERFTLTHHWEVLVCSQLMPSLWASGKVNDSSVENRWLRRLSTSWCLRNGGGLEVVGHRINMCPSRACPSDLLSPPSSPTIKWLLMWSNYNSMSHPWTRLCQRHSLNTPVFGGHFIFHHQQWWQHLHLRDIVTTTIFIRDFTKNGSRTSFQLGTGFEIQNIKIRHPEL